MCRGTFLDEDGVYDPAHFNDRLLLGLKGTMSEAELHVLKCRLQGGIINKARRGELEMSLPIGLVYDGVGRVVLDPDRQVQDTVRLVFDTFRETGSAYAVVRRLRGEKLLFPQRVRRGIGKGDLLWGMINHSRVLQLLHNPRYAGAFVYGRTRVKYNAQLKPVQLNAPRSEWQVLIQDAHPGYIPWEEFERNQATLRSSLCCYSPGLRGQLPRHGSGLLQGRVLCGRCGARMHVHYEPLQGAMRPYYVCNEATVRNSESNRCQWIRGIDVDQAISTLLLQTVTPTAIEVALAVQQEIVQRVEEAAALRQAQLQRARYEAELARRRYLKVDPDNRLVADALEADWNARLRQLDTLQQEHDRQQAADQALLQEPSRQRIVELAQDFPRLWKDPRTSAVERKRMVGLLIEDVTLTSGKQIDVGIRWRGGRTQSVQVQKARPIAQIRKTLPDVVQLIDKLLETSTYQQIATRLNELGHRNWRGDLFTEGKINLVCHAYGLKGRYARLRERGMLTAAEVALQLGVTVHTVKTLARKGWFKRHVYGSQRQCLYEPPGDVQVVPGVGGRYRPRPIHLIPVQPIEQGAS